jgi:hypothetical protein
MDSWVIGQVSFWYTVSEVRPTCAFVRSLFLGWAGRIHRIYNAKHRTSCLVDSLTHSIISFFFNTHCRSNLLQLSIAPFNSGSISSHPVAARARAPGGCGLCAPSNSRRIEHGPSMIFVAVCGSGMIRIRRFITK